MNSEEKYELTYKFKEQSDYDAFIEAQTEYPKLRRFIDEFEIRLINWRKHGACPDFARGQFLPGNEYIFPQELEQWYFEIKKAWME